MSSHALSKPHHPDTLRLLAELQGLVNDPSPAACFEAITDKWGTLQNTYYSCAELLESRKKQIDGSEHDNSLKYEDKYEEKYIRYGNLFITATHDYSTHSRHTTSLARQILALSGEHQQWERTFKSWQFELARADLDRMDRKCEKLKGLMHKWEKRMDREDRKVVDCYTTLQSELESFDELHQKMEDVEGKLKALWSRERWCKAEDGLGMEARADEVRKLESWRRWPVGRLCAGVSVWECVLDHEHPTL